MAVSLIHEYLARRMSTARRRSRTCAPSTSSTSSTTTSSAGWAAAARAARFEPGDVHLRAGRASRRGLLLLLEGTARTLLADGARPSRVGRAGGADLDRRDRRAHGRAATAVRMRRDAVPRWRSSRPTKFRDSRSPAARCTSGSCAQIPPVMTRLAPSSRTASAWPRWARWPPGSRTSSTTRPPPPSARRRELADALRRHLRRARRVRRGRDRARGRRAARRAAARGARAGRAPQPRSTRWTRPTPRTTMLERAGGPRRRRGRGGSPSRWRRRASTATGSSGSRARRAGDGRGAALGGRVADRARAWPPSCSESTERMSGLVGAVKTYAYMDRGGIVEVDIHEGLETTLVDPRPQAQAHHDRGRARLRPRRCRSSRSTARSSTRSGRTCIDNAIDALGDSGTITHHAPAATATASASTSPTTGRHPRGRSATASSTRSSPPRTSARARAWASTPRGGSSRRSTAAASRSTRRAPARRFTCGCRYARRRADSCRGDERTRRRRSARAARSAFASRARPSASTARGGLDLAWRV